MLKKERMPSNCHSRTSVKSSKYLFHNKKSNDKITLTDRVSFVHHLIRGGINGRDLLR